ncbi:MAG TPA: hypothetical protein D7I06_02805 [Candidatus Poseidoniales archaeon]|nr:MAG TPA: hypothetical protein D7I06_02805 [Candidatus Poseidoniales archaeon]HII62518.1 hypothetical protein [Candidatus Poseidoniaceae archaeon]
MSQWRQYCENLQLSIEDAEKIRYLIMKPKYWVDWHREATRVFTSDPENFAINQKMSLQTTNKGALIESRWKVTDIRFTDTYFEIEFLSIGQYRMEKPVGGGVDSQKICFTVVTSDNSGLEITSTWRYKGWGKLFKKNIRQIIEMQIRHLLEDLQNDIKKRKSSGLFMEHVGMNHHEQE